MEILADFYHIAAAAGFGFWLVFIPLVFIIWFIPSILAIFFNRKQAKFIFLANIPAGFSFIAWGACIAWALSGKMSARLKVKTPKEETQI